MGSIFFPWAVIFLAKSLGGFHPFTFVTFLLQVKKVTKKPRRCAAIGLKLKPSLMQANSFILASNILLVSISSNKPAFLPARFLIS
ncbi:hypothetical protein [Echinicola rosea]|uniref:hypothetical protein n=1 Tax=Echinicola rosea TaxID=1807691 RepID=UPI0010CA69FF|nr:hypothetical protein [Echinicola rosea]